MAKGEIACVEQFLLLSLSFQKAEWSESVYMRERFFSTYNNTEANNLESVDAKLLKISQNESITIE